MNGTVPSERSERQQDFRLLIGTEPFDPREAGTPARRRGAAELSGGHEAAREATIVQFAAALTWPDAVRLVAAYGLKLDRYIPNLAYLERLPAETVGRLRGDFLVRACIALDPALKLAPSIGDEQPTPDSPIEFNATLFDDADISAVESALGAIGARDVQIVDDRPIGGRAHARFMLKDLARLTHVADIDDLVWVEPAGVIVTRNVDAAETIQSGTVAKSPIWDHGLHGENQVIGVIDNGPIAIDHCFFADAAPNRPGPGHRKVLKMFNESGSPVASHATQVAGIAAGDERGNSGAHRHRGGAWAAKLVCSNFRDMLAPKSRSLLHMLKQAKGAGAFIHTNSWGKDQTGTSGRYNKDAQDVDDFSWHNEDHLVLAAGSNTLDSDSSGRRVPGVNSPPGIAKNTLCVAAARAFPSEMSRGSGVDGPTADKRRKPEIMAVGCELEVATIGTTCGTGKFPGCHTSYATPHAAAAAALVRQYFMEGWYPNGKKQPQFAFTPTGALLKAVLLNSTVDMMGEPGSPSNAEGWGLIRLNRALYFDGGPRRLAVQDVRRAVGLEERRDKRTHSLFVNSRTEQLKITLVWTDPPPGEYGYMHPSQNIIRLTVEDPEGLGVEYLGNDFDSGVSRREGHGFQDLRNNVQMVIVNDPPIGPWTITLRADTISLSDEFKPTRQGYALVASGGLDLLGFLSPP